MGKPIDETGNKYGRLTVLEYVKIVNRNGNLKWKWKCQCDCGNFCYVDGADLRRGHTTSCGCYKKEQTSKASVNDLTGQKFGELEVLERDMNYTGKHIDTHWFCLCHKCGNVKSMSRDSLVGKKAISCGCMKSKGEYIITKLLNENQIKYKSEYNFEEYKNRFFDFALLDENNNVYRLIEFDGIQHYYRPSQWIWSQNMTLEEQKERDKEKNNIAKKCGIELIRVPYWKKDSLTIEQLLDDTFLVKEEGEDK